jgi:V8-like Glu-specific endopeptidase
MSFMEGLAMQAQTLADQLFFTTCYIEARSQGQSWVGTGFVYAVETNAGAAHFLVTNKHVLGTAESVTIRMIKQGPSGEPSLGNATKVAINSFNDSAWVGHPDASVDVGVMGLGAVLNEMQKMGAPPFFRVVPPALCLSLKQEQELDAIEEVVFIGYPNGLFDSLNLLPILRTGTTATPISVDYQGVPAFLIDASVFPGSSGSPVFIANRGMYFTRDGSMNVGTRVICLGILAAVHTRQVHGAVGILPSRLVTTFAEPIDLGIVYKARCIDECIGPLLQQAGLVQKQATELMESSTKPSLADEAIADSAS